MTQPRLFDSDPPPKYVAHSDTSREAALSMAGSRAATQRRAVLDAIRASGARGMTDEEIQQKLDMNPSSVRPRRGELLTAKPAPLIRDSLRRRPTSSGRAAVVWVAAEVAAAAT
jgi:hypothetical protein